MAFYRLLTVTGRFLDCKSTGGSGKKEKVGVRIRSIDPQINNKHSRKSTTGVNDCFLIKSGLLLPDNPKPI